MSTKPTAQELQQAACELIESETFSPEVNDFWDELTERAAELASQRELDVDRIEALSRRVYHGMDDADLPAIQAALRAYAASLRSKA